ncbi:unnamed protein product [Schistocephalus solidus]|uniref:Transposase n=1 Tax=Schistocephalus solidus TaxID=70667 RepID=A0A183SJE6_SCHSO|nr:unnamed protein product [Schistocephalus solidus]
MAQVTRELTLSKGDIAALCETRFLEQGQMDEVSAGYNFFGSGHCSADLHNAGVAFLIRSVTVRPLLCMLQFTNDQVITKACLFSYLQLRSSSAPMLPRK